MPLRQLISNNCTISHNTKQIDFGGSVTASEKHIQRGNLPLLEYQPRWIYPFYEFLCNHDTKKVVLFTENLIYDFYNQSILLVGGKQRK